MQHGEPHPGDTTHQMLQIRAQLKREYEQQHAGTRGRYEKRIYALEAELKDLKQQLEKAQLILKRRGTQPADSRWKVKPSPTPTTDSPRPAAGANVKYATTPTGGAGVVAGAVLPAVYTPFKGPRCYTETERAGRKNREDMVRRIGSAPAHIKPPRTLSQSGTPRPQSGG